MKLHHHKGLIESLNGMQMYMKQAEEMVSDVQQQHAKCAHGLKRQAANAEPYVQVFPFPQPSYAGEGGSQPICKVT